MRNPMNPKPQALHDSYLNSRPGRHPHPPSTDQKTEYKKTPAINPKPCTPSLLKHPTLSPETWSLVVRMGLPGGPPGARKKRRATPTRNLRRNNRNPMGFTTKPATLNPKATTQRKNRPCRGQGDRKQRKDKQEPIGFATGAANPKP